MLYYAILLAFHYFIRVHVCKPAMQLRAAAIFTQLCILHNISFIRLNASAWDCFKLGKRILLNIMRCTKLTLILLHGEIFTPLHYSPRVTVNRIFVRAFRVDTFGANHHSSPKRSTSSHA